MPECSFILELSPIHHTGPRELEVRYKVFLGLETSIGTLDCTILVLGRVKANADVNGHARQDAPPPFGPPQSASGHSGLLGYDSLLLARQTVREKHSPIHTQTVCVTFPFFFR